MLQMPRTPTDQCIYCGSVERLTKEHIVPSGLGGTDFLPKASCPECAKKTGSDEQYCLRTMFWGIRKHLGLQSAHKHKDQPQEFIVKIISKGVSVKDVSVPPVDEPLLFTMGIFDPPGILLGRKPSRDIDMAMWMFTTESLQEEFRALDGIGFVTRPFHPLRFSRMLAKIAHAKAVAELGLHGFKPHLPDLILGKSETAQHWVGCYSGEPIGAEEKVLHRLHLEWHEFNGRTYVTANIRLFAQLGAPTYWVVVGEV